jgi:uncharacterized membrane protein
MAMELVVWVSDQASEASRALQALKKSVKPAARNSAVLVRERDGQVFVVETGDVDLRSGMLLGAAAGLLVALLGGSSPERATVGTMSIDLPEEYLMALQASLQPGGSALLLLLETEWLDEALNVVAGFQGRVWQQSLAGRLLAEIAAEMTPEGR